MVSEANICGNNYNTGLKEKLKKNYLYEKERNSDLRMFR